MSVNWNSPVLKSLEPVIRNSKLVRINEEKLVEVANWMAYEEFQKPMVLCFLILEIIPMF